MENQVRAHRTVPNKEVCEECRVTVPIEHARFEDGREGVHPPETHLEILSLLD